MPYLSRQILYFESKKMPVSENALRWFGECCEELGECDDDMWKVFKVSDLVCGEPYSITNTLEVFGHGRPLPEVLDWHEAHMIRAAILQKYLDASQGKLNLEASKVKSVGLPCRGRTPCRGERPCRGGCTGCWGTDWCSIPICSGSSTIQSSLPSRHSKQEVEPSAQQEAGPPAQPAAEPQNRRTEEARHHLGPDRHIYEEGCPHSR